QDDPGIGEELPAGRGDDLLELDDDLTEEQHDATDRAAAARAIGSGVGDDVLTGLVDNVLRHCHYLPDTGHTIRGSSGRSLLRALCPDRVAGRTGLEPATCGFGDRCSTN